MPCGVLDGYQSPVLDIMPVNIVLFVTIALTSVSFAVFLLPRVSS